MNFDKKTLLAAAGALLLVAAAVAVFLYLRKKEKERYDPYYGSSSSLLGGGGGGGGGGDALSSITNALGGGGDEAEDSEDDATTPADAATTAVDETDAAVAEEEELDEAGGWDPSYADGAVRDDAGAGEDATAADPADSVGLTAALGGGGGESQDDGAPEGFWQRRLTVERSIVIQAHVGQVWFALGESDEGLEELVPGKLRKLEGKKSTLWQVYEPIDATSMKLTFRTRPTSLGGKFTGLFSKGRRGRALEKALATIKAGLEQETSVASAR